MQVEPGQHVGPIDEDLLDDDLGLDLRHAFDPLHIGLNAFQLRKGTCEHGRGPG